MEHIVYNQKGQETGKVTLPEAVFGAKWKPDLVHQVAHSLLSSRRRGTAHTKNRGEVSGGGKKPWRQKGTGRARHGSIRSPLWVGGGVTHGPRSEKKYARKVNKKMRRLALYSVLSRKLRDGEILFLDAFSFLNIKTSEAKAALRGFSRAPGFERLSRKPKNAAFILLPDKDTVIEKSFRNFGNVAVGEARNLNVLDALAYTYIIIARPTESFSQLIRK